MTMCKAKDIAAYLHISEDRLYTLIRSGKLKAIRIGTEYRISDHAVNEFETAMQVVPIPPLVRRRPKRQEERWLVRAPEVGEIERD